MPVGRLAAVEAGPRGHLQQVRRGNRIGARYHQVLGRVQIGQQWAHGT